MQTLALFVLFLLLCALGSQAGAGVQAPNYPLEPFIDECEKPEDVQRRVNIHKKAKDMLKLYQPLLDDMSESLPSGTFVRPTILSLVNRGKITRPVCNRFVSAAFEVGRLDTDMNQVFEACLPSYPCRYSQRLITSICIWEAFKSRTQHWKTQASSSKPKQNAPIIDALIHGDTQRARTLIENGAPVMVNRQHQTALMAAAFYGNEQIFAFILQQYLDHSEDDADFFFRMLQYRDAYQSYNVLMYLGSQNAYRPLSSSLKMLQHLLSHVGPKSMVGRERLSRTPFVYATQHFLKQWLLAEQPLERSVPSQYVTELIRLTDFHETEYRPIKPQDKGSILPTVLPTVLPLFAHHFRLLVEHQLALEAVLDAFAAASSYYAEATLHLGVTMYNAALVQYLLQTRSFTPQVIIEVLGLAMDDASYATPSANATLKEPQLKSKLALQTLQAILKFGAPKLTGAEAIAFHAKRVSLLREGAVACYSYSAMQALIGDGALTKNEIRTALQASHSEKRPAKCRTALRQAYCSLTDRLFNFELCSELKARARSLTSTLSGWFAF